MTKKHDIIWLDSTDSTNEEVRRRISEIDNLSVVSAFRQTAGRGQRGNKWSSEEGQNLMFSIALKFERDFSVHNQFRLSQVTAISVVELLSRHGISARIKWPNDIYAGNDKICGILVENSIRDGRLSYSIIGIGLNVNQKNFDVSLPNPTSMSMETGKRYDMKAILEEFMDIFSDKFPLIYDEENLYDNAYHSLLFRRGITTRFKDMDGSGNEFEGQILGVNAIGQLRIELTDGIIREFSFKEVSFITSWLQSLPQDLQP